MPQPTAAPLTPHLKTVLRLWLGDVPLDTIVDFIVSPETQADVLKAYAAKRLAAATEERGRAQAAMDAAASAEAALREAAK